MRCFDRSVWFEKALIHKNRYSDPQEAQKAYELDIKAIDGIETLVKWCESEELNVIFSKQSDAEYDSAKKSIEINFNTSNFNQLTMISHEIGHYLIRKEGISGLKWSSSGYAKGKFEKDRSLHYKIDVLEEEYLAWDKGLAKTKELGVELDMSRFNEYKVSCIKGYVLWAAGCIK